MASAHALSGVRHDPWVGRLQTCGITEDATTRLSSAVSGERRIAGKRDIRRSGAHDDGLVVLLEGWACRYRLFCDGRRHISMIFLPGDLCNPAALYGPGETSGIGALSACRVLDIDIDRLGDDARACPSVTDGLAMLAARENAVLTERTVSVGRRAAIERVAHLLCELSLRLALAGHGSSSGFRLAMTQEDMADTLGLTGVHVNRMLHSLRADGLIDIVDRHVKIKDWAGLCATAMFDDAYLGLPVRTSADERRGPTGGATLPLTLV